MGTKLTELRDGCFSRALDDEPLFVLLARDPSAPDNVDAWADNREHEIGKGRRPGADMEHVHEARQCARNMRSWREQNDGAWRTGLFGTPHVNDGRKQAFAVGQEADEREAEIDKAYQLPPAHVIPELRAAFPATPLPGDVPDPLPPAVKQWARERLALPELKPLPEPTAGPSLWARTLGADVKLPVWLIAAAIVVGSAWNVLTLNTVSRNSAAFTAFVQAYEDGNVAKFAPIDPE